jgi:peptide/nickel transport system substrate-binding protein
VVTLDAASRVLLFQAGGEALEADFSVISTTTAVQQSAQWTQVDNMTWEDGAPVTSADALLAFAVASSPQAAVRPDFVRFAAAYEALDDQTVRWTGLPGYASPTYYLHHAGFFPQHLYAELTPEQILTDPRSNRDPLAYGPFKLDEWAAGDHITFSRNPTYWRALEGLPHLDELVVRFMPNANQILAQIASGRCDLAPQDSVSADQYPLIRQLEAEGLVVSQIVADTVFDQLAFNALPAEGYPGFAGQMLAAGGGPVFSDPRVRKGLAHCLDREALVAQGLGGAGLVPQTYAPPGHPLYAGDENVAIYAFDPAQGLALLAEAGWTDTNNDGMLDNGAGQNLSFVYSARSSTRRQAVMPLVQGQLLSNCHVEVSVELHGPEYTNPGPEGVVLGRRFDASQLTFRSGSEPPCSLYTATSIPNDENGWEVFNIAGFSHPDFDAACLAAYEATDPAEKAARHAEAQRIWAENLPAIILYTPARVLLTRPGVLNASGDPTATSDLWNVENFDLAP